MFTGSKIKAQSFGAASHRYAHPQSKRSSRNTKKNHGRRQSLLWFLSCRKIFRLILPFRNPIIYATLYFVGLSMSICVWSGHASASIIFTPFCSHSFSRLYYICFYVFVYCLSAELWCKCDRLASSSPFLLLLRSPPVEPGVIFTPKDTNKSPPDTFLRATGGDMYYSRIIMPLTFKSF